MISVVLPSRNETMLEETCRSMLNGGADEIIVIDDGSVNPVSLKMDKVKVHRLNESKGPSYCRNFGGATSTGDVVIYSDAHVLVPPDGLKKIAELAVQQNTVVCAACQPLGGRNWVGYGGVVVDIGGGYDVKYNRDVEKKSPTGFIGSVYGATRQCWNDIGWWPTTLSWGYNEQALSLAVLYAGKMPYVASEVICLHQFKKKFNYPVAQSITRVNRLLVHYQCCENFETRWLPIFKVQFRHETAMFEKLLAQNKVEWDQLRDFRKTKRQRTDQEVEEAIAAWDVKRVFSASRISDTPGDKSDEQSVDGTVCLFTAFAPGREAALSKWIQHVESAGYPINSRVFVLDNDRPDIENYARECGAPVFTRPPLSGTEAVDIANHLAGHWNEVLPELMKSDFILSVEDDVFPAPGYLKKLMEAMKKYPEAGVVGAAVRSRHGGHIMAYMAKSIDPFEISHEPLPHERGRHRVNSVSFCCTLIRTKAIKPKFLLTGQPNVDAEGKPSGNRGHEFSLMKHVQTNGYKILADYDIITRHKLVSKDEPAEIITEAEIRESNMGKENFVKTRHCSSRVHCKACRESQAWRDSVRQKYAVPLDWDIQCPNGIKSGQRTMVEMASTFAQAVGRAANAALQGKEVVTSASAVTRRWRICQVCQWYQADTRRCQQCGCFLDAKIRLATEKCPIDRWKIEAAEAQPQPKRPCGGCKKRRQAV